MPFSVSRYHDISCGHRVVGHEGKCRHLHGHNYRIHFHCESEDLDDVGRVIDFTEIKTRLCMWVEENWDHKFLAWEEDTLVEDMYNYYNSARPGAVVVANRDICNESFVFVPFNPTAENMAQYLVEVVAPEQLKGTGIILKSCTIDETAKCSASYSL